MVERLSLLLQTKNLTSSQFADEINVQRSSMSHVMNGRNKASLEFVQRILMRFPDINAKWLLFGDGAMFENADLFSDEVDSVEVEEVKLENSNLLNKITILESDITVLSDDKIMLEERINSYKQKLIEQKSAVAKDEEPALYNAKGRTKKIERIVTFFNNKTFVEYFPE